MRLRLSQRRCIPGPHLSVPAWADEAAQRPSLFELRSTHDFFDDGTRGHRCEPQLLSPPFCLASTCYPSFLFSEILSPETAPREKPGAASGADRRELSALGPLSLGFAGRVRGKATTSVHEVRAEHKALQVGPQSSEAGDPTASFVSTCHSCCPWTVGRDTWDPIPGMAGRLLGCRWWPSRPLGCCQRTHFVPVRQDTSKTA